MTRRNTKKIIRFEKPERLLELCVILQRLDVTQLPEVKFITRKTRLYNNKIKTNTQNSLNIKKITESTERLKRKSFKQSTGINLRPYINPPERFTHLLYSKDQSETRLPRKRSVLSIRHSRNQVNNTKLKKKKVQIPVQVQEDLEKQEKTNNEKHALGISAEETETIDSTFNQVYTIINNKCIEIDWYSKPPATTKNSVSPVQTTYILNDIISHNFNLSCGYLTLTSNSKTYLRASDYVMVYKVESGKALVETQLLKIVLKCLQSFYIPLGCPYSIKNCSDTELLVLFFAKMQSL